MRHTGFTATAGLMTLNAMMMLVLSGSRDAFASDGVIVRDKLSHSPENDRTPVVPLAGEGFVIEFYSAAGDLTAARVAVDDGADGLDLQWFDAIRGARVGPLDRWSASVPASESSRRSYAIEATDGGDVAVLREPGVASGPEGLSGWWQLDFSSLTHAPLGATPVTGGTVFRVWAPNATSAAVRGTFNSWSATAHPMLRVGEDFIRLVPGAVAGHKYKYYFNARDWRPDPRSRSIDNFDNYNSVIRNTRAYQWRHRDFSPAPAEQWVVYQLHVGTFAGRNDPAGSTPAQSRFRDVTARVGHLAELGVNAVMLNPVNEFPGAQSGGYNSISMFALETTYGTPDDFKAMVDALHGAGIAVILDVVWNHFTSTDNFLWMFDGTQIYFDSPNAVGTPWGPQANVDSANVRSYFLDSMETMFGEFLLDGYRHDAIYTLVGETQAVNGQNLVRESMRRARTRFPDTHIIGEIYNNSAWNTTPQGIDLDGQYHEAFKNAIKDVVYDAAFGDPDLSRLASTIDGSGFGVERDAVFNYFELHDEAWPLSGAGRTRAVKLIDTAAPHDDRYALGRTKLGNGVTILAQGVPAILMGTEWAEDAGWEVEKIDWSHKQTYRPVFNFYRDLIGLRTTRRALFANSPIRNFHVNDAANVMAWERSGDDGRSYVVVANFSNADFNEYRIGLPRAGDWGLIINSEDAAYMGRGVGGGPRYLFVDDQGWDGFTQSVRLVLPAHGMLVLQHSPEFITPVPTPCPGDANGDRMVTFSDVVPILINFDRYYGPLSGPGDADGDGVVNFSDVTRVLVNFGVSCP